MLRYIVRRAAGAAMDRKGVTAAEYAILAVGVVIIVAGGIATFGGSIGKAFQTIDSKITEATTAGGSGSQ